MPIYEYKCIAAGHRNYSHTRASKLPDEPCRACYTAGLQRTWGFSFKPPMHSHLNPTTGQPVSDMRQFTDQLKAASEAAEIETGIPHNYKPMEWGDHAAAGATAEGIDESNKVREARGDPLLPEINR